MEYPIRGRRGAAATTMGGGGTTTAAGARARRPPRRTRRRGIEGGGGGREGRAAATARSSKTRTDPPPRVDDDDDDLDFPVSSAPTRGRDGRLKCRAVSCRNYTRGHFSLGLCGAHHERHLMRAARRDSLVSASGQLKDNEDDDNDDNDKDDDDDDVVVVVDAGIRSSSTDDHPDADAAAQLAVTEEPRRAGDGDDRRRGRSPSGVVGLEGTGRSNDDGSSTGVRTTTTTTTTTTSRSSRKRRAGNGGTTIDPHRDDATTKKKTMTRTKTREGAKYRDDHVHDGWGEERPMGGRGSAVGARGRERRPPSRYVARPSVSGWGVEDGDAAFLIMAEATVATAIASSSAVASGASASPAGDDDDNDDDDDVGNRPGAVVAAMPRTTTTTTTTATMTTTTTTTTTTTWLGSWWGPDDGNNDVADPVVDGGDEITPPQRRRRGKRDRRDRVGGWPGSSTVFDDGSSSSSSSAAAAAGTAVPVDGEGPGRGDGTGLLSPPPTTNASEGRDGGAERREPGQPPGDDDDDARKGDLLDDDRTDEDEVVFVYSSRVEGMGGRGARSLYSGRLRGGRDDLPSPRPLSAEGTRRRRRGPRSAGDIAVDDRCEFGTKFGDADVSSERESFDVPSEVDDWNCCGKLLEGRRKRCGKCFKWRGGRHPMPMRKRKSNFFGDVGADAMRPVGTARCGECDGRDAADRFAATAASTMHDIRSPVVSKDRDRLGLGGLAEVSDVHLSGDARGMSGPQVLQDCDESDIKLDVKSDGERHITPNDQTMENNVIEDDDLSLSELGPQTSPLVTRELVRQKRSDPGESYCEQTYWRCSYCGGLNSRTARCGTCRHFEVRKRETALLERTRFELLNGRDFWICTVCEIAMPSLTAPCGGCRKMISFVPLEIGEFEEFVRKQREMGAFLRQGPMHEKDILKSP